MTHRLLHPRFPGLFVLLLGALLTLVGCGSGSQLCLTISRVSVVEGNSGTTDAVFVVKLSEAADNPVVVSYATVDGTATAGSDYTPVSGTLTFAPGVTSQSLTVPVTGDTAYEADETFSVNFTIVSGNGSSSTVAVPATIVNDDLPTLSIADSAVTEGNGGAVNATFTVTLSNPLNDAVTVDYATADGSATAGSDYTAASGTLTFAAGSTSQTVTVPVLGDTVVEADETFTVTLSNPSANAALGTATAIGTILNDDFPVLTITGVSVTEGNSATTDAIFTVTASPAPIDPITVTFASADGTAVAGSDYIATSGSLTFNPGVTSQTITVAVIGETVVEADETFDVALSNPVNATLGTASATGTILNDDFPTIAIAGVTVLEGDSGVSNADFAVTLSEASPFGPVSVDYASSDGTATTADGDYTATAGTLTIAAGDTAGTISVPVNGDTTFEPDETLTVTLTNPSANVVLGTAVATGTLLNDDPGGLADTAITTCSDGTGAGLACPQAAAPRQDAQFGWDAVANDNADGTAGFSYVKVDATGAVLADTATTWSCILDRRTGLMWEAKTGDSGLHDRGWTYTWLDNDATRNGGVAGTANGGSCGATVACDTESFVAAVNTEALCGRTGWRLPSMEELRSLVDYTIPSPGPSVDVAWFPNTLATLYWSFSTDVSGALAAPGGEAWALDFGGGFDAIDAKSVPLAVRLVRGAP